MPPLQPSNGVPEPRRQLRHIASAGSLLTQNSRKYKESLKSFPWPFGKSSRSLLLDNPEFPGESKAVTNWAKTLVGHYTILDEKESESRRQRLSKLALKELNWFKEVNDGDHQYVVATVADPDYNTDRYIRLDRRASPTSISVTSQEQPRTSFTPRKSTMSSSSTSSSSSKSSYYSQASFFSSGTSSSSSGYSSPDSSYSNPSPDSCTDNPGMMWTLDRLPDPETDKRIRLMERIAFRAWRAGTPPPTLLDLALTAKAADTNNSHHLWPSESLWFCIMVMRVLQQAGFSYVVAYRDPTLKFQTWMGDMMQVGPASFKARAIQHEQHGVIQDILLAYQDERQRVIDKINVAGQYAPQHHPRSRAVVTGGQIDIALALAAEASASAAEATAKARETAAQLREAQALAQYETRLRAKAEEKAERQARRNAASEAELLELRRKLAEMQSISKTVWINRKIVPRDEYDR